MMKVEVKKLDKLKRRLRIQISGEEFLKERDETYRSLSKNLRVPGFRPGNAPLEVLKKHHGKFLQEELLKKALPLFYQRALEEQGMRAAGLPEIYDIELASDVLSFSAEFEAKPQIELMESSYKGIKIKDKKVEVETLEIEKVLTNLQEGVKKVIPGDINDEQLAHWASYPDSERLREAIKGQLFVEKLRERRQKIEGQVREHLLKTVKVEVPKTEVEQHHQELVEREIYNLRLRGVSQEDIDKYKSDLQEKLRSRAEDEVKLFYILEAIARKEAITIDANLGDVALGFILSQAQYE